MTIFRADIRIGDIFERLAEIPDESIDCIVTSPPYWGLRNYGVEGQLGLEPTLAEHIETVVRYCAELHRVLKPTGTFWLNYGDCYATSPNGRSAADTKALSGDDRTFRDKPFSTVGPIYDPQRSQVPQTKSHRGSEAITGRIVAGGYMKPKDLCMVPNRVAIALQDWGWWVRSEIIWAKPNPMPESARDRPGNAHEKIFLLTKSARYSYDHEAVRKGRSSNENAKIFRGGSYVGGEPGARSVVGNIRVPTGWDSDTGSQGGIHKKGRAKSKVRGLPPRHATSNSQHTGIDAVPRGSRSLRNYEPAPEQPSVWRIATRPFKDAHFATFPPELAERCILAGCPEGGTVLDPFGGAGTTGLVAQRHGRRSILIELNPDYAELARTRLAADLSDLDGERMKSARADHAPMPLFAAAAS